MEDESAICEILIQAGNITGQDLVTAYYGDGYDVFDVISVPIVVEWAIKPQSSETNLLVCSVY